MTQRRYGAWPFARPFVPTVCINAPKGEFCNVCENKNWVSTISFVLETHVDYTQMMIQIMVTIEQLSELLYLGKTKFQISLDIY